jgi:ABC-type uncharacterized transport system substrate-binding protein
MDAFDQALRNFGYVEGRNIEIHRKFGEGRSDRLAEGARELAAMDLDAIVAFGPAATTAAARATSTTPVVMSSHDAVEQGLVASLNRPGGNVTGWSVRSSESGGKQLELLKDALPGLSRVAVIFNPASPGQERLIQSLADNAKRLRFDLYPLEVSDVATLDAAFVKMRSEGVQAFFLIADPVMDGLVGRIVAKAAEDRIPAMYPWRMYVVAGGLMSYGPNLRDLVARSASFVDRILKGAKPADIPVETPDKYGLVLNLKTAHALGITFPMSVRTFAVETIE